MRYLITLILFSILLVGCSYGEYESKKIDTITQLKPIEKEQYNMFVFFDFPDNGMPMESSLRGEVDDYLQKQYDIYDTMMARLNPASKVHTFGFRNASQTPEQIDFLNIEKFPTFIILDNTGIVLFTTDIHEAEVFLQTLPDY